MRERFLCMQQNGFHNDADAAQQKKHDGQLLQPLSADVRGEEPGQPGGAEGGGQRDKAEAQGGAVQEPGAEIQPGAEQVFTQKEEANAALEFIVILGSALKVGYQKHIDAEQPRAHTGEEGHQIPQPRDLPTVRADGALYSNTGSIRKSCTAVHGIQRTILWR